MALLLQELRLRAARTRRTLEKAIRAFERYGDWLRRLHREVEQLKIEWMAREREIEAA